MVRTMVEAVNPKMQKAVDHLAEELKSIRTGRASTAILDGVMVDHYGAVQPLKALASVSTPDARTIAITPWDKTAITAIEKSIRENSALGLNPMNDGSVVRLSIPALTEERRREVVKSLGSKIEDCRIALRNIRHDTLKDIQRLEKDKQASLDDVKFADTELNKLITLFQGKIEVLEVAKTKELMEV
jgi:ribosome recycling factor